MSEKKTSTGSKVKEALGLESDLSAAEASGVRSRTPREELTPAERKKRDDDDNKCHRGRLRRDLSNATGSEQRDET